MLRNEQTILALDTATHCGYAVYKNGKVITAGVWNLERKTDGTTSTHAALYNRLHATLERYNITHIVKESVYLDTTDHRKDNAFKVLCELGGIVRLSAQLHNIPAFEIATKAMHRYMFKKTLKRATAKEYMCNRMKHLGYVLPSRNADDMADALGLLFTYLQKEIPAD